MRLFFWKNVGNIEAFASDLAEEFFSNTDMHKITTYFADKMKKPEKRKFEAEIKEYVLRLAQFKGGQKLGVYGKAKLHLVFTERLKELGYDAGTAKKINNLFLVLTP